MKTPTKEMQEVLNNLDKLSNKPLQTISPEIARQQSELKDAVLATIDNHIMKRIMGVIETVEKVEHTIIDGPGGDLLLRIYSPIKNVGMQPATIYFHGGGMVIANLNTYDASCRAICNAANCIVISVAYRQSPEHKYPAAAEDAYSAYHWVLSNAATFNIDVKRIAVMGESSGGNLAAGVCLQAKQKGFPQPVHQVLIYPMLEANYTTKSYNENEHAKPLNKVMMQWFWNHYLEDSQKKEDLASPINADDLSGLAPATIVLAEIDPLLSEGEAYAAKLKVAGVAVSCRIFDGVTHEFFGMGAVLTEARQAVAYVANELMNAFDNRPIYYNSEFMNGGFP